MSDYSTTFTATYLDESALFGSAEYWAHHRAALSEGLCPHCAARLEPVEHAARLSGYCSACDLTCWADGPDKEWAAEGESVGRG